MLCFLMTIPVSTITLSDEIVSNFCYQISIGFLLYTDPFSARKKKIYSGKLEGVFSAEIKVLECVKC